MVERGNRWGMNRPRPGGSTRCAVGSFRIDGCGFVVLVGTMMEQLDLAGGQDEHGPTVAVGNRDEVVAAGPGGGQGREDCGILLSGARRRLCWRMPVLRSVCGPGVCEGVIGHVYLRTIILI
jgi:hypothetical protein